MARYESLNAASAKFARYQETLKRLERELSPAKRTAFIGAVKKACNERESHRPLASLAAFLRQLFGISGGLYPNQRSFGEAATFLALACLTVWMIWSGRDAPQQAITPESLLNASVSVERGENMKPSNLVASQKVRISAAGKVCTVLLHPKGYGERKQKVTPDIQTAEAVLAGSGIPASDPLSAVHFLEWHNRQHVLRDEVSQPAPQLLTLTTITASSEVTKASITFRESDFHAVARMVETTKTGPIEVAEVEYRIVPWKPQMEAWFEPAFDRPGNIAPNAESLASHTNPSRVLPQDMDEVELGVRLMLSRLNADTGEQIVVSRSAFSVLVKGIVESDDRKRQLETELSSMPLVDIGIQSLEQLQRKPILKSRGAISIVSTLDASAQTPLEKYLRDRPERLQQAAAISKNILSDALVVDRESKSIEDLENRFNFNDNRPYTQISRSVLRELLIVHHERLSEALLSEERSLAHLGLEPISSALPSQPGGENSLYERGDANLRLCRRLVTSGASVQQPATAIASDLSANIQALKKMQVDPALSIDDAASLNK